MRIAVLSRNRSLHSIRRLLQEASTAGVQLDTINPLECQLVVDGKQSHILVGNQDVPDYDAVLPRIGASITEYGLAVVKQFEALGYHTINHSQAIAESRDKMRCAQILMQAGLLVPPTVLTRTQKGMRNILKIVGGMPAVLKVLQGTQGVGVMLVNSTLSLASVLDAFWGLGKDLVIQQFIAEGAGRDYRVLVVGKEVVAAMMRTAPEGEFRSNIHRGGAGSLIKLPKAYERAAVRATEVLGLEIAGVDLIDSDRGPMILEVNSSPGFEGIERATGLNIAGAMVHHMIASADRANKRKLRQKLRGRS